LVNEISLLVRVFLISHNAISAVVISHIALLYVFNQQNALITHNTVKHTT